MATFYGQGGGGYTPSLETGSAYGGAEAGVDAISGAGALLTPIVPPIGVALDVIGLIGKGVLAYQAAEERERERKKAEARYEKEMAENRRRWEAERDMEMKKYALSLDEWKETKRAARINNKQAVEQRNYERANTYSNRLLQLANSGNRLLQVYGGAK